jgi:hypothetical protein
MAAGAFVFHQVFGTEYGGDVLFDGDVFELLDDGKVDPQRFAGKLELGDEFEDIPVLFKLKPECLDKSGVPGQAGYGTGFAGFSQSLPRDQDTPKARDFL